MPYQSVAMDLKVVFLGVCRISVGVLESEVVAGRFDRFPLHCVLGSEGVEVGLDDFALTSLVAES